MAKKKQKKAPLSARPTRPDCGTIRQSKRGRWRALSLILVHVVIGLHVLHWYLYRTTLTPVEPSEAMQTLGQGLVNAGAILFAATILATLVFGRFFCGWGCHIIALQDLCTTLLKRVGIRPRPFRSRLLVYAPLLAAIYMFAVPTLVRMWLGAEPPPLQPHFTTDDMWSRFPSLPIATLTFFVCGFLIVYLLGNKGFCTYGCPYGGIFGLADQLAPGKIRVTDACEGCAHCTATCSSNVRVHEEVRDYGMVVDPGCMKCMDCVSVCPKDALYFGFGAPSIAKGKPPDEPRKKRYDYNWPEEIALAGVFLVSVVAMTKLYGAVPLLLALGLAAISAWMVVTAARVLYARSVRFSRFALREGGTTTRAGWTFVAVAAIWITFLAHSGWVQYLTMTGNRQLVLARRELAVSGGQPTAASTDALTRGIALLENSDRLGLVTVPSVLSHIAMANATLGRHEDARTYFREAAEHAPGFAFAHYELALYALDDSNEDAAITWLRATVDADPEFRGAHERLLGLLEQRGQRDVARDEIERLLTVRPSAATLRRSYATLLARQGDIEGARDNLLRVIDRHPRDAGAYVELASIESSAERYDEALVACQTATTLEPDDAAAHVVCARIAARLVNWKSTIHHLERAAWLDPYNAEYVSAWAKFTTRVGGLDAAIAAAERLSASDRAARFRLVYLYRIADRLDDAERLASEFSNDERFGLP